jgi:hypothetical protein
MNCLVFLGLALVSLVAASMDSIASAGVIRGNVTFMLKELSE